MKFIFFILCIAITGCADMYPEKTRGGWCYLRAGLYLVTGDIREAERLAKLYKPDWPTRRGSVRKVFETYNTDETKEIYEDITPTFEEMDFWISKKHFVVIVYKIGKKYHAEPYTGQRIINPLDRSFVAGNFFIQNDSNHIRRAD